MYRLFEFDRTKANYEYIDFKTRYCEEGSKWTVIEVQAEGFFGWMDKKMSPAYFIPKFTSPLSEKEIAVIKFLDPDYSIKNFNSREQIPLEMPIVSFNGEELVFTNGRHRSRALEYLGVYTLFIEVQKKDLSKFSKITI